MTSARRGERISDPDVYRQGLAEIKERMSLPAFVAWGEGMIAALEQRDAAVAAAEQDRDEARARASRLGRSIDRSREALGADYFVQFERAEAAVARAAELEDVLAWGETFLARHDAFLQRQTPELAHAMKDAADGFRAALASSLPDRDEAE